MKVTKQAREIAIDFMNWTAGALCEYSMTDEDSWAPIASNSPPITTAELFDIYLESEGYDGQTLEKYRK